MYFLLIYTVLLFHENDLKGSIYHSQTSNMHIAFLDEDLYLFSSPFEASAPIPYWVRRDTLFFGLSHENDFALLRLNQSIELSNEVFDLLSKKRTNEILHYMEMTPGIRNKASIILKEAHFNTRDFRVGNIVIRQKKEDDYNELNLEAVCRYTDSDGIDRGFKAKLTCLIIEDKLKIDLLD